MRVAWGLDGSLTAPLHDTIGMVERELHTITMVNVYVNVENPGVVSIEEH